MSDLLIISVQSVGNDPNASVLSELSEELMLMISSTPVRISLNNR